MAWFGPIEKKTSRRGIGGRSTLGDSKWAPILESSMKEQNLVIQSGEHQRCDEGAAREVERLVRGRSDSASHPNSTEILKRKGGTEERREVGTEGGKGREKTLSCVF